MRKKFNISKITGRIVMCMLVMCMAVSFTVMNTDRVSAASNTVNKTLYYSYTTFDRAELSQTVKLPSPITSVSKNGSWIHTTKIERSNRVRIRVETYLGKQRTGSVTVKLRNGTVYKYKIIEKGTAYR